MTTPLLVLVTVLALFTVTATTVSAAGRGSASLPRPNPVYTAEERNVLREHFKHFLRLKAAEPLVHVLPTSGILFQILSPAPWHLSRYCGGGGSRDAGAVEADVELIDMFNTSTVLVSGNGRRHIVQLANNAQLFKGDVEVLRRIPENEVWRVYYSGDMAQTNTSMASTEFTGIVTEVVGVRKVWANRMPREVCRRLLVEELGYDPYARDIAAREAHPELGIGLQVYTYPLPAEEEEEEEQ